jgi:hypothetical protein
MGRGCDGHTPLGRRSRRITAVGKLLFDIEAVLILAPIGSITIAIAIAVQICHMAGAAVSIVR